MNSEQRRLDTFQGWPPDAAVSPAKLAQAGLYAEGPGFAVRCFSCKIVLPQATYDTGTEPMITHQLASPNCRFVDDQNSSGNIAIGTPSLPPNPDTLKDETVRLSTFTDWPVSHIVTPEQLARAGFFYLNIGDSTKCAFCMGVVRAWEPGDDPDKEHMRHFGSCPFVRNDIAPRLQARELSTPDCSGEPRERDPSFSNLNLVSNENLQCLGVHSHKGPKKPHYGTVESRLRTFGSWSPNLIQTPEVLAQAGFYYEGSGDLVRCFHCDGGLRHWDPQDDPWTEHARWFPLCSFIKLVKGQDFVTACALETNLDSNLEEVQGKSSRGTPPKKNEVTERELQEHMTSDTALAALSIGINFERVKMAIREKLERTGRGYPHADALVEAALNMQLNEEDMSDEHEPRSGLSNQVKSIVGSVLDNLVAKASSGTSNSDNNSDNTQTAVDNNKTPVAAETSKPIRTGDSAKVSLEEENRLLREARLCKICMDAEVGIVFLPCGHLATCVNCAPNLEDCPVCRSAIKATVRTFLS